MARHGPARATLEGHAPYLESWLQVLRSDRTAVFTAARHAGAAFDYIAARAMPPVERRELGEASRVDAQED